ncbi:MAG: DoxX [Verrucomicrobiales bacterium]|nr:DoxX [Verrucomicrobiales bacterium]
MKPAPCEKKDRARLVWIWVVGISFVVAGTNHFANPEPYLAMMPGYLLWPHALVQISGIAEILGGVGFLFHGTRPAAAWGLIALLVAVFPANLNVALHGWPGIDVPRWIFWARLPLQLLFLWWVYRIGNANSNRPKNARD